MRHFDVVIVGSGFGGSILARALNSRGMRVALIERFSHPRFAIGESSTPLAALSLERLAADYDLPDLHHLAAYGRWQRHLPTLGHGLKRGFTFHDHRRGSPAEAPRRSLLVAASPDDARADCHWLRADVDHHLVERAQAEGVTYWDRTEVLAVTREADDMALTLDSQHELSGRLNCHLLVDATGPNGLAKQLGVAGGPRLAARSGLLYGHFDQVAPLAPSPRAPQKSSLDAGYLPHQAAVHHLIDEGWIYELHFDDGRVSAGALLVDPPPGDAATYWAALLGRYPALAASYAAAKPLFPIATRPTVQHRLASATGPGWVALPHAFGFVDPLYSSGIAWTLRGVERLAQALTEETDHDRDQALARYESLLQSELTQIDSLITGAYAAMTDFELFAAYSMTYFGAVSWAETRQRLLQPDRPMWEGFLGVDDPLLATVFTEAREALPTPLHRADQTSLSQIDAYRRWVLDRLAPRDIAGLDLYGPQLSVPVDFAVLVERAPRLGLDAATLRARLPLLRADT